MSAAVPRKFHTVTPTLAFKDCAKAIDWYQKAFRAMCESRMETPDGRIAHAEIRVGDSPIMLADEWPGSPIRSPETLGSLSAGLWLYVESCDAWFQRAIDEGATVLMPVADQFWGDRMGTLLDPFGYLWNVATHKEDLSEEELKKRSEAFLAQLAQKKT